jgi:DNA polymerase V
MAAVEIPLVLSRVQAGFPSPADDYLEGHLDIHRHLVKRPASTLFFTAPDDTMSEFGIFRGDLVIVDCSLKPSPNKFVLIEMDGDRMITRLVEQHGRLCLAVGKKHPEYKSIDPDLGLIVIGVATCVIHPL